MPPIIYGNNPKYGRLSIQVPALTRYAIKHKQAGFVGTGKKTWSVVHVLDLAKVRTALHKAWKQPQLTRSNRHTFKFSTGWRLPPTAIQNFRTHTSSVRAARSPGVRLPTLLVRSFTQRAKSTPPRPQAFPRPTTRISLDSSHPMLSAAIRGTVATAFAPWAGRLSS